MASRAASRPASQSLDKDGTGISGAIQVRSSTGYDV
jgi:hypothetical protein